MGNAQTFGQIRAACAPVNRRVFSIMKSDDDKRLVFGWASVAVRVDGEVIEDYQEIS